MNTKYLYIPFLLSAALILFLQAPLPAAAGTPYNETPKTNPNVDPVTKEPVYINFVNGSFETPNIYTDYEPGFRYTPAEVMAMSNQRYNYIPHNYSPEFGWLTVPVKEADKADQWAYYIEIRHALASSSTDFAVNDGGTQFAELNAQVESRLYQYCNTLPGQKVYYEYHHKGRNGVDQMNFFLSAPGEATAPEEISITNSNAWVRYYGVYQVPTGQTVTEFAFESISAAGNSPTAGNYLDAISLFYPSFLEIEKSIENADGSLESDSETILIGETLTYKAIVTNTGETESSRTVFTDILPDGVTYLENSTKINGSPAGTLASWDAGTDTLRINIGSNASAGTDPSDGGCIGQGESVQISFQVRVTGEGVTLGDKIYNQAKVTYNDQGFESFNGMTDEYNVSNIVAFILTSPGSLEITKHLDIPGSQAETFIFLIEYRTDAAAPVSRSFYGTAAVTDTDSQVRFTGLLPGHYTVTELSSNWEYSIDISSDQIQSGEMDGIQKISDAFDFHNNRNENNFISGKASLYNAMAEPS